METTEAEPVSDVGLDTVLFHLHRSLELLKELRHEQHGMPEKHILENLAIFEAETESTIGRLTDLIREMRGAG